MTEQEERLKRILEEFVYEVTKILESINTEKPVDLNYQVFFGSVRSSLFGGRLSSKQVSGMEAKLKVFKESGVSLSQAAYLMATSYHETARRMQPVREGLTASDNWRKRNLRYYPWYGRGDVQLTWRANYKKVDDELGLEGELLKNPDLALDPVISARALVAGVMGGWYNGRGHGLAYYVPSDRKATKAEFTQARRTVNILDKASMIADQALKFQDALEKAGY